jgi:hypothetical protein
MTNLSIYYILMYHCSYTLVYKRQDKKVCSLQPPTSSHPKPKSNPIFLGCRKICVFPLGLQMS